jgi:hypothetical protein
VNRYKNKSYKTSCIIFLLYRVCLDAKNSVRIEELRITNEDSEKIVIFSISVRIVKM